MVAMAKRQIVTMTDDLDPSLEADETLTFGVDGATYEIDLASINADSMRLSLQPYVSAARRVGGRATAGRATAMRRTRSGTGVDPAAVKAWANSNGVAYNKRGRLSSAVVAQFREAMG